jgi:hypothetical protein
MHGNLKDTIVAACEVTGIGAALLLIPLAAIGFDRLDLVAVAIAVPPLFAALAIRVMSGVPRDPKADGHEPRSDGRRLGLKAGGRKKA